MKYGEGDLEVTLSEDAELTFTNRASGLSNVDVGKLFDRFYTVDSVRKSTGLGLFIAKLLAELMRGSIGYEYSNNCLKITPEF